jgi:hypothetical protein
MVSLNIFYFFILESEQTGIIRVDVIEDFYHLGLFDLNQIDDR